MCARKGDGGGGSSSINIEDVYQRTIGNGRTYGSELDGAETVEQVREAERKMSELIKNSNLDKQSKIAYEEATKRRTDEAYIRVAPIRNKKEMIEFFKTSVGVDVSPYIETGTHFGKNFGKSKSQIVLNVNEMTESQRRKIGEVVKKKGMRSGYTPGFDWIHYYFKK